MPTPNIAITKLSSALGAEIAGVDLSGKLDQPTVAALRRALLDHVVIFFRDQRLRPRQLLDLSSQFGEPAEYPFLRGLPELPLVIPVIKEPHETVNFGGVWHSDTTYLERPMMATLLYALEVPEVGGDTLFANMYLAYDRLSDGFKRMLAGLRAENRADQPAAARTRVPMIKSDGKDPGAIATAALHPVVRVHPETGRKALYVSPGHVRRFEGMSEEESAPLLEFLFAHQIKPEFTCRFCWRPGSLAFWDNRASLHYPLNDYHGQRRVMHRVTLAGDVPR